VNGTSATSVVDLAILREIADQEALQFVLSRVDEVDQEAEVVDQEVVEVDQEGVEVFMLVVEQVC